VQKKIGFGLLALLIVGAIIGLSRVPSPGGSQAPGNTFEAEGTFKDEAGNRIYTFEFTNGTSIQMVRAFAEGLEFTAGFLTAAYFYAEGAVIPLHSISLAKGVESANGAIYKARGFSPWQYAFTRTPDGALRFVDCQQAPDDVLCRKD
jgi:hypothetical protein